jgi:hypothetical protein
MLKLAVAVLAGATIVAAQMPQGGMGYQGGNVDAAGMHADSAKQGAACEERDSAFAAKMKEAMEKCGTRADSAREYARTSRGELAGKTGADSARVVAERDSAAHVRLQGAIDALDRNSTRMGTQVRESQERTAVRMQERRDDLIQLQQKILERKAAQAAEKAQTTTDDAPAAN